MADVRLIDVDITDRADGKVPLWDDATNTHVYGDPSSVALGAWTSYTPTLTAVTTNPTLGSSTVSGRYKLLDANTGIVVVKMVVTTGGAWNAGNGEWKFSLPSGWTASANLENVGSVHILDSGTARFSGVCMVQPGATVIYPIPIGDSTGDRTLKHNNPVTWATNDQIDLQITVELA